MDDQSEDEEPVVQQPDRLAPKVLERALTHGSVSAWAQARSWKQARNQREVGVLAQALDALLDEGVKQESLGVEILCRRVTAVHLADKTNNWTLASAVQLPTVADSLLPLADLNQVIRNASAMARVEAKLRPPARSSYYTPGGGYGRGSASRGSARGRGFPSRGARAYDSSRSGSGGAGAREQ